jgi:dihydroxyacetone kinase-like protein
MAEVTRSRKLAAEFIGTAALVICGPGTAAATGMIAKSTGVAFSMAQLGVISFAFMMVIIAMIYTIGHISGCHINPAVTLALTVARKAPWSDAFGYLVAQFTGAIAGGFAIWTILGQAGMDAGQGVLSYAPGNAGHAFSAELIGTFLLVLVVFGSATDSRATPGWHGLAIPAMVFAAITVVGPVTGAALNPARYLGPMVATAALGGKRLPWGQAPTYLVATFLAGLLAAAAYAFLGGVKPAASSRPRRDEQPRTGRPEREQPQPRRQRGASSPAAAPTQANTVDARTLRAWIVAAAQLVVDNAHLLTHLDAVIGDADHGVNMRRGFQSAVMMLEQADPATPGAVLDITGQAFMANLGGAAGPLYGSGLRQAAKTLGNDLDVSPARFGAALSAALDAIQELGAAVEGDKTMVDALGPAVSAYRTVINTGGELADATRAASDAATRGQRATAGMQARKGRASYIGARSIGHEDPGAASTALILQALATTIAAANAAPGGAFAARKAR